MTVLEKQRPDVDGNPALCLKHGAQMAVEATIDSLITRDGQEQQTGLTSVVTNAARRKRTQNYPELARAQR